jgi:hypothetical protein
MGRGNAVTGNFTALAKSASWDIGPTLAARGT